MKDEDGRRGGSGILSLALKVVLDHGRGLGDGRMAPDDLTS